jgi:hypothetical protein
MAPAAREEEPSMNYLCFHFIVSLFLFSLFFSVEQFARIEEIFDFTQDLQDLLCNLRLFYLRMQSSGCRCDETVGSLQQEKKIVCSFDYRSLYATERCENCEFIIAYVRRNVIAKKLFCSRKLGN